MQTAALLIAIASTVVFPRVLFEIAFVAPEFLRHAAVPLIIVGALVGLPAGIAFVRENRRIVAPIPGSPPSDLRRVIVFGVLYAAVLLGVAFARDRFGTSGLYFVAMLSGLTDMNAITLSVARLVGDEDFPTSIGWRAVVIGALANLVFKAGIAGVLGSPKLMLRLLLLFTPAIVGGILLVLGSWPD